ncbi:MAG: protoheme IX farnesyltransferase [Rhizobiales bacterium]|nr:protoheme IX farnesyltransferase [Hyphomicrobiales bacterium]
MSTIELATPAEAPSAISLAGPRDYFDLLKPRVMSLVIFTAFVGIILAPHGSLHPVLSAIALLCIAVGAGASGALNMWYDADIDAAMSRTAKRPIPSGRVTRGDALGLGLVLSIFSVMLLGLAANWVAAGLLAFTIFFYAVIYTMWLKRATPQNIVIGGAAGAFPPVIGWAAVTGSAQVEAWVLFAIIFLWTPPHFWALALFKMRDYHIVGMPMLPNVAGERATRFQMLVYSVLLAVAGILPWAFGFANALYGIIAAVLGLIFVARAIHVWVAKGANNMLAEKKLFGFSILYLFLLFAALLLKPFLSLFGL